MNREDVTNLNEALLEQLRIKEKSNQLSQAAIDLETKFLESIKNTTIHLALIILYVGPKYL